MIERKFVTQNLKEFSVRRFIVSKLNRVGLSDVKLKYGCPIGYSMTHLIPEYIVNNAKEEGVYFYHSSYYTFYAIVVKNGKKLNVLQQKSCEKHILYF